MRVPWGIVDVYSRTVTKGEGKHMAHKKVWFITGAGRGMGTDIVSGVSRPQGAGCDIGAFELEVSGDDEGDDEGDDDEGEDLGLT